MHMKTCMHSHLMVHTDLNFVHNQRLFHFTCNLQVNAEFNFMFGEDTPERMATNWNKILPAVLKFGGEKVPEEFTQHSTYKAIEIIDKAFRSSGATAKSDPAFVMYEV